MTRSLQAGNYVAYIPRQGVFTEPSYYVKAIDKAGNTVKTTVEKLTVGSGSRGPPPPSLPAIGIPTCMYGAIGLLTLAVLIALLLILKRHGRKD